MDYRKALRTLLIYVVIPAACAGGPVAWFSGAAWGPGLTASLSPSSASKPSVEPSQPAPPAALSAEIPGAPALSPTTATVSPPPAPSTEEPPIHDMAEVFRFDLSPRWITENWPRVSTALGQLQLQGYRVPLVTGPAEDDLAGSLTYYFNPWQQLQRITFVGTTGDVRRIITLMTAQHGFARRLTNDPGQFIYEAPGDGRQPRGILWIRQFPVLKADHPHERYEVHLTIERPVS